MGAKFSLRTRRLAAIEEGTLRAAGSQHADDAETRLGRAGMQIGAHHASPQAISSWPSQ